MSIFEIFLSYQIQKVIVLRAFVYIYKLPSNPTRNRKFFLILFPLISQFRICEKRGEQRPTLAETNSWLVPVHCAPARASWRGVRRELGPFIARPITKTRQNTSNNEQQGGERGVREEKFPSIVHNSPFERGRRSSYINHSDAEEYFQIFFPLCPSYLMPGSL